MTMEKVGLDPKDITRSNNQRKIGKNDFMFITSGRGTQTKDGTLLTLFSKP